MFKIYEDEMPILAFIATAIAVLVLVAMIVLAHPKPIDKALLSAVALQADGHTICGATIVSTDGKVLTAGHCVVDPDTHLLRPAALTVVLHNGKVVPAFVESVSAAYDLATLRIDLPKDKYGRSPALKLTAATLGSTPLPGDAIFTIGSPMGEEFQITQGTFSVAHKALKQWSPNDVVDRSSLGIFPGNSGGGVFDSHGNLIGVVSRVMQMGGGFSGVIVTNIALTIPADDIRKIIGG